MAGKRESRRLLGDVVLAKEDLVSGKKYPDACVPTGWSMDLHLADKRYNKGFESDPFISTANFGVYKRPYWIPYRCFYSRNVPNLFMAGRDISVTHEALGARPRDADLRHDGRDRRHGRLALQEARHHAPRRLRNASRRVEGPDGPRRGQSPGPGRQRQLTPDRRTWMNSKERVYAALRREPVDRIPIFMWFHPGTRVLLAKLFEVPPAYLDVVLGNDVRMTWVNNNYCMEGIVHERDGQGHVDPWGIKWVKEGPYNQIASFPLANCSADELLRYQFPQDHREELLANMEPVAACAGEYFIGCDISPNVFEMYWRLRGMEQAMVDMAGNPELANEMLRRCADFATDLGQSACQRFPLDCLWTGDDVASQRSLMMSPATWRRMIKPHLKRAFDVGKAHGLAVAYHCCGALRPIIADLVEMGLDILNPIQCNCPGMNAAELKARFWLRADFHGRSRHAGGPAPRHGRRGASGHAGTDRRDDRRRRRLHPGRVPHHPAGNAARQHLRHVSRGRSHARGGLRPRRRHPGQAGRHVDVVAWVPRYAVN